MSFLVKTQKILWAVGTRCINGEVIIGVETDESSVETAELFERCSDAVAENNDIKNSVDQWDGEVFPVILDGQTVTVLEVDPTALLGVLCEESES